MGTNDFQGPKRSGSDSVHSARFANPRTRWAHSCTKPPKAEAMDCKIPNHWAQTVFHLRYHISYDRATQFLSGFSDDSSTRSGRYLVTLYANTSHHRPRGKNRVCRGGNHRRDASWCRPTLTWEFTRSSLSIDCMLYPGGSLIRGRNGENCMHTVFRSSGGGIGVSYRMTYISYKIQCLLKASAKPSSVILTVRFTRRKYTNRW